MSENNNNNNNQKTTFPNQQKRRHKYVFSKQNILNHENTAETNEIKQTNHNNEHYHKSHLTNLNNNSILTKLRNKIKERERHEISYLIGDTKRSKNNNTNTNTIHNKKYSKSIEKKKLRLIKRKKEKENSSFINHKYFDLISPLHINNLKMVQDNIHKKINYPSICIDNNDEEKKSRYNNSFRGIKKKIKINKNRSFEVSLDNSKNNKVNENKKTINLTSLDLDDNDNISNDVYLLSSPKDNSTDDDIINNEEIINMSKRKNRILEEIKLKKQELRMTELSIELLKHKYKKKSNHPISNNHKNNKIISKYNLTVSIPRNHNSLKSSTNKDSSSIMKKSFYAKTSINKNRKRISPSYNKDSFDIKQNSGDKRINRSLQLKNHNINNININLKSNRSGVRNKSRQSKYSPYENKIFSFPQKKEKNNINKNYQTNIYNKINLSVKLVSPEKINNNNSIEFQNYISNKMNINNSNYNNMKKLKINTNNNTLKKKNNIFFKKKNYKKEINIKEKKINSKKKQKMFKENFNSNNNRVIKEKKIYFGKLDNIKNERQISRNIEKNQKSLCNDIKLNDSEEENKTIRSFHDDNNNVSFENNNFGENDIIINRENKSILVLESICKKGFAGPGVKKTNQDNFFIYNNFNNNPDYIYMGICDGHGMFGQGVSTFLVNNLPQNLNTTLLNKNMKNLSNQNITILTPIFVSTFISTNNQLSEDDRIDTAFSGSTCVSLLYTPSRIICINVGDSRCVLGKFDGEKWISKNLSRDHKPDIDSENERIVKSGGRVEPYRDVNGNFVGPERVWVKGGDLPGLAMSRSFGDEVAHLVGVITEPEIVEYFLSKEDKFVVLGSDGLWEFISSEECIEIVKDFYLEKNVEGALTFLYKEASKRWILEEEIIDDITILIAFFK